MLARRPGGSAHHTINTWNRASERIDGVDTRVLSYQEVGRPTLITGAKGEDVPSSGQVWVDPADGAVLKTRLDTKSGIKTGRIEVAFRRDAKLALVVPAETVERHKAGAETVTGHATYANFRGFTVQTTEEIRR